MIAELRSALAQLRHAYAQLKDGAVRDQVAFADGLIAPQIKKLEELEPKIMDMVSPDGPDFVLVSKEPSEGLLMSMAIRYDHGLGCPGYYDQQMYAGRASHAQKLESTLRTMRQLHEEVTHQGFYQPERERKYTEWQQKQTDSPSGS